MRIGLDLDNTIINYDQSFIDLAKSTGLINQGFLGSKTALRDGIRAMDDGEKLWQKLQGSVYGTEIFRAKINPGVQRFLARAKLRNCECFVVSHKTQFGHFDATKTNLREAALDFLKHNGLFGSGSESLIDAVFFEETRAQKITQIDRLNLDVFIDDLPEVLLDESFPRDIRRILFNPNDAIQENILEQSNCMADISFKLFGHWKPKDVEFVINESEYKTNAKLRQINGRGNSSVFQLQQKNSENSSKKADFRL